MTIISKCIQNFCVSIKFLETYFASLSVDGIQLVLEWVVSQEEALDEEVFQVEDVVEGGSGALEMRCLLLVSTMCLMTIITCSCDKINIRNSLK